MRPIQCFSLGFAAGESATEQQSLVMDHRIQVGHAFLVRHLVHNDVNNVMLVRFSLQEGVVLATSYGISLAKTVRFSDKIIKRAFDIHDAFVTGDCTPRAVKCRDEKCYRITSQPKLKHVPSQ